MPPGTSPPPSRRRRSRRDQAETSRLDAAETLAQVATDLAAVPDTDPNEVEALRHALDDATAALDAPPDAAALALADAIEATEDELERIGATPEDLPPLGAVEHAVDRLAAAEAALAAAKTEAAGVRGGPPDWWQRLHAPAHRRRRCRVRGLRAAPFVPRAVRDGRRGRARPARRARVRQLRRCAALRRPAAEPVGAHGHGHRRRRGGRRLGSHRPRGGTGRGAPLRPAPRPARRERTAGPGRRRPPPRRSLVRSRRPAP